MKGHLATLRGQSRNTVHRQRHEGATQSLCHQSFSTLGVAEETYSGSLTKSGVYPLQPKAGLIQIPLTACCLSPSTVSDTSDISSAVSASLHWASTPAQEYPSLSSPGLASDYEPLESPSSGCWSYSFLPLESYILSYQECYIVYIPRLLHSVLPRVLHCALPRLFHSVFVGVLVL